MGTQRPDVAAGCCICQPLKSLHKGPQGPFASSLGPATAQESSYSAQSSSGVNLRILQNKLFDSLAAQQCRCRWSFQPRFYVQAPAQPFAWVADACCKHCSGPGGSFFIPCRGQSKPRHSFCLQPYFCVQTCPPGPIFSELGGRLLSSGSTEGKSTFWA